VIFAGTIISELNTTTTRPWVFIDLILGVNFICYLILIFAAVLLFFLMIDTLLLVFKIDIEGNGLTVILKEIIELFMFGLSSVRITLTSYTPGSVSFEQGCILKLGYFPYMNRLAMPKSHETKEAVSSMSGSIIEGNISVLRSFTVILISLSLVLKEGGPVLGMIIVTGI
jgi:hypothetical protein